MIPYIGDLVSNDLLYDPSRIADADTAAELFTDLRGPTSGRRSRSATRADVAKTIYYRRRKGTLPMLEELARDVTGWAAHAVEFFELLGWTPAPRAHPPAGALVRRALARARRAASTAPFDEASHSVDVRADRPVRGLAPDPQHRVLPVAARQLPAARRARPPRPAPPWRFHFSPLGNAAPLFTALRREGDEAGLATELHVPGADPPRVLQSDLDRAPHAPPPPDFTDLYGTIDEPVRRCRQPRRQPRS